MKKTKLFLRDIILPLALYSVLFYTFFTFMSGKLEERREMEEKAKEEIVVDKVEPVKLTFQQAVKDTFYYEKY